jgi:glutathionylspermidine synthase
MKRERCPPRADWRRKCEEVGFPFHSMGGTYWDESACYAFTGGEIDELEAATERLHRMCLEACDFIVDRKRFDRLAIQEPFQAYVAESWRRQEPSLLGRFDLRWDGVGAPKLLEYNADTPTALLEASVVQWHWMQQAILPQEPSADQFNSLHEKLIASWRALGVTWSAGSPVHFACAGESEEDCGNLDYLRDVALQAGVNARFVAVEDIGWNAASGAFVDTDDVAISVLTKLYPWEWLIADAFGAQLLDARIRVIEPAWKMLLSNKGLLPILWELFPDHPNLLPAYFEPNRIAGDFVEKPLLSREGANVVIHRGGEVAGTDGSYGSEGSIRQARAHIPRFGDDFVIIGSWMIGDEPAGIGLREDATEITRDTSRFVPHYFV